MSFDRDGEQGYCSHKWAGPSIDMDDAINAKVGAAIRFQRIKKLKITQEELAIRVGLSRPSIANIERGRQQITVGMLVRFSQALNVAPAELLPVIQKVGPVAPPSVMLGDRDPAILAWADRLLKNG